MFLSKKQSKFSIKRTNKKASTFLCSLLAIGLQLNLYAQLNTPFIIASSGFYFSNSDFSNSYTIGEMCLVETAFVDGNILTQGFQQPDYETETEVINEGFIPNGFSPNGDGFNDNWEIPYLNTYPESTVKIFNRWGQELYTGKGNLNPWTGTYKDKELPTADYYYIITIESANQKLTGTVTLKK